MGEYWLNIARYSESDGFLDDLHDRLFWPYRDWVIAAFNKNMPFDQFGTWQLAGDLMPSHTKEQGWPRRSCASASGPRRTAQSTRNTASSTRSIARSRSASASLATTVGCARCHDHKYDPIPTKDFYSLTGFFNSTDEPGYYATGALGRRRVRRCRGPMRRPRRRSRRAEARLRRGGGVRRGARRGGARDVLHEGRRRCAGDPRATPPRIEQSIDRSSSRTTRSMRRCRSRTTSCRRRGRARPSPPPLAPDAQTARAHAVVPDAERGSGVPGEPGANASGCRQARGRGRARAAVGSGARRAAVVAERAGDGERPAYLQSPILKEGVKGKAFYFDDTNRGILGQNVGQFERTQPFSVDLWVRAAAVYDDSTVFNHQENDQVGNAGTACISKRIGCASP